MKKVKDAIIFYCCHVKQAVQVSDTTGDAMKNVSPSPKSCYCIAVTFY